jgi:type I restriction enzyme, S subunit
MFDQADFIRFDELAYSDPGSFSIGPFGSAIKTDNYVPSGVPVVRGVNLARGIFVDSEFVYITDEKADELARANLVAGDLVFTHRGTIGQVSMIPRSPRFGRYVLSSSQVKARLDPQRSVPEFYYYWFRSPAGQRGLLANASVVGVPGIGQPLATIKSLQVPNPRKSLQSAIAGVLGALDDKIAVNDALSRTVRALGRARLRAAVECGDVHMVELSSSAEFLSRGVTPRYTEDDRELRVLNQKCVRDGRVSLGPSRRTITNKVVSSKLLKVNDVLVNSTGMGTLGRVARWTRDESCTVDSHLTIVRFDEAKVDPVCAGFAMLDMEQEIEALGEGSTGQTELSRTQLSALRMALPSRERSAKLRPILDALENRGDVALAESESLTELRDTLLPKLMSGEIRVRDAEKVVEDAVLCRAGSQSRSGKTTPWTSWPKSAGIHSTARTSLKDPGSGSRGMS